MTVVSSSVPALVTAQLISSPASQPSWLLSSWFSLV
jgi:hypothetical protein